MKDYYFINLNVVTPSKAVTRSSTRAGEDEVETIPGFTDENALVSAHVYFCTTDYKVLADFESDYVEPMDGNETSIRIKVNGIEELTSLAGETVRVLIVGNKIKADGTALYSPAINRIAGKEDLTTATFPIPGVTSDPIGDFGEAGFNLPLMSADYFQTIIPKPDSENGQTAEDVIKALFSRVTPSNAWWDVNGKSNRIKLERGVARIEFRGKVDAKVEEENMILEESYRYEVDGFTDLQVELTSMAPFNINKNCYLFHHTSAGSDLAWLNTSNELFGVENGKSDTFDGYNWIVSPWWTGSSQKPELWNPVGINNYRYTVDGVDVTSAEGSIAIEELKDRARSTELTWEGSAKGGYHPWCYVSENTLYSTALINGTNVGEYATGVAFKFKVLDKTGAALTASTRSEDMPQGCKWSVTDSGLLEITDYETGNWVQLEAEGGEYYLTYIAYLIHNVRNVGGPMYIGVVRNNTYQISISKLAGLPNPREPRELNLVLEVNVLDWNKRDVSMDF